MRPTLLHHKIMTLKFIHSQITHRGNHREQNEDSCENKETLNGHLFVTCDGMGGAAEGKKASSIGVKSIIEFFEKESYENLQIALYQSLKFANEQIYATAQINPSFKGMGTTACVVLFNKDEMFFAHLGDSRIYLQTDGKLKHLTRDHSFVNQLVDQGTIKPNEAKNHPEKNRILKALGVHIDIDPTVSSQPTLLKKEDVVLLCSDGLTDMVSDPSIEATLNEELTVAEKTDILLQKALDNGGKDNITVQLIEITDSPHTKTVFIDKTIKDLATTLTGEEGAVKNKKYKFSKKYLLVLLPVLLLLGWLLVSVLGKNEVLKEDKIESVGWKNTPVAVILRGYTKEQDSSVASIDTIYSLFELDQTTLAIFNNGKKKNEYKRNSIVYLKPTEAPEPTLNPVKEIPEVGMEEIPVEPKDKYPDSSKKKLAENNSNKIKQNDIQNNGNQGLELNQDSNSKLESGTKSIYSSSPDIDPLEVGYFYTGKKTNKKTNTYQNIYRFKINNSLDEMSEENLFNLLNVSSPNDLDSIINISEDVIKILRKEQKKRQK